MSSKKQRELNLNDEVYVQKYNRPVDKVFNNGTVVIIVDVTELDGERAYVVENKKGKRDTLLGSEIKLKRAAGRTTKAEAQVDVQVAAPVKASKKAKNSKKALKETLAETEEKKAKKVRPAKTEKPEQNLQDYVDPKEFQAMNSIMTDANGNPLSYITTPQVEAHLHDTDPLSAVKSVYAVSQTAYMELGGVLSHIYNTEAYKDYGYTGAKAFKRFIEDQVPNMESSKAFDLIKLYSVFTNFEIPEAIVGEIGCSKCYSICRVATPENIQELIGIARTMSVRDLKAYIAANYFSKTGIQNEDVEIRAGEVGKRKHLTISMFEDQHENLWLPTLDHLNQQYPELEGNTDKLFIMLLTEYSQNLNPDNIQKLTEEKFIKTGEAAFPAHEVFLRNRATKRVLHSDTYQEGQVSIHTSQTEVAQELEMSL